MRRAIELAAKAYQQTDPNPMVGAVLVKADGRILSEGYHQAAGLPHAEVIALQPFSEVPADAVLVVTLEPCAHHGRTPPCTDLIIRKKVRQLVIGCVDPNPRVAGAGIRRLRAHGVQVQVGVCEEACRNLNRVFNKHIVSHLPYVTLKAAVSLDGKIAMPGGESRWITGELARQRGHQLRSQHQAIAVGSGTLNSDNPRLNDRVSPQPRQPVRVVFAGSSALDLQSWFVRENTGRRILLAGQETPPEVLARIKTAGVEVWVDEAPKPRIGWGLARLYQEGLCSLLLEGGATLTAAFLKEKMVDRICLFVSGKIIGRREAPTWSGELGHKVLADVSAVRFGEVESLGDDLLIHGYFQHSLIDRI